MPDDVAPVPIALHRHGAQGPQIAVLHGGPGAPGSACSLARSLAGEFRVLEPLQRRAGAGETSVAGHVADHAAVLPPALPLVGWSWGAMLALSYAAAHPERVSALALVGCGTYDLASRALCQKTMIERLGEAGRERMAELGDRLAAAAEPAERDRLMAEVGRLAGSAQDVDAEPEPDHGLPVDEAGHVQTWADVLRLQEQGVEPAAFEAVTCPVLMLHGAEDPHPGQLVRDTLRRHVRHLEYVEFPRCGHSPWRERAARESFHTVLVEWLLR